MLDQEIQSRMDAYRGNPQALMQRYAQSQQLIDLLALQKLKSEKEAAARQMQMNAPGQMPTVAQQREQQVMDMTKQEVAQRVGQVAQQQAKQQQDNLQRAAQSGIAQAPAPNMMPAQAMASGGIVAFAEGGTTGEEPSWIQDAPNWLKSAWREADARGDARALQAIKQRADQLKQAPVAAPVKAPAPQAPAGVPPARMTEGPLPPPGAAGLGSIALPTVRTGAMPSGAPAEAAPPAAPTKGQAPSGLQQAYESAELGRLNVDPEAVAASRRAAYEKEFSPLYAEQQAAKQQGLAALEERKKQQQAAQDPLTAFLLGARGRSVGEVLGSAGRAAGAYGAEQLAAQAALDDQLQKLREAQAGAKISQTEAAYGKGEGGRKEAIEERAKAVQSAGPYLTGMAAADARRDIAERDANIRELNRALGLDEKTSNMIRTRVSEATKIINQAYADKLKKPEAMYNAKVAADIEKARAAEVLKSTREIYAEFGKQMPEVLETAAPAAGPAAGQKVVKLADLPKLGK